MTDEATAEAAKFDACENAIEEPNAGVPQTHEGTQARKRAYREGRLISRRQADNRDAKAALAEKLAEEHAANEAKAAAVQATAIYNAGDRSAKADSSETSAASAAEPYFDEFEVVEADEDTGSDPTEDTENTEGEADPSAKPPMTSSDSVPSEADEPADDGGDELLD